MTDFAKRQELKLMLKAHRFEGDLAKLVEIGEAFRSDLKEVLADMMLG